MSEQQRKRTHKRQVEIGHAGMSQEQVRAAKCARRRESHKAIREANREAAEARVVDPLSQLKALDFRLGMGKGAKRERAKLGELLCKAAA